jgi:YbbR domain-containing protein
VDIVSFVGPGLYSIPVLEHRIGIPPGLAVTRVTPSYVTVRLEREVVRRVPVLVPYAGKPATGYTALAPQAEPAEAEVRGPESLVASLEVLKTAPVDLAGADAGFKKEVPLSPGENPDLSLTPSMILVTVSIQADISERTFEAVAVSLENAPGRARVEPGVIDITVRGPVNTLKKSGILDQIAVYIDAGDLAPGVHALKAVIRLPLGLILTEARPELFTVTVD